MSVSPADVHLFAKLARLRLAPDEAERLRDDLNRILAHVDHLGDLEAGEIPEHDQKGLDTEAPSSSLDPDPLSHGPEQMTPDWQEGFFVVPPPRGVDRGPS